MKRTSSIAICILMLCSLLWTVGTAMAFAEGYEFLEYWAGAATIDGTWTTAEEWAVGEPHYIGTVQKGMWIMQANADSGGYWPEYVIEFADSTQDAGDIIQVCMNGGVDSTSPTAGADFKMEIQGLTTKKVYEGTGSGWAESSTAASAVTVAATVTTSAHDPAQHVIAEFSIDKAALAGWGAPPLGVRIACYDASTDTWVAWPPESSADNPSTWGQIVSYSSEPYPEGLTVGVMLLVSSVAVVVSIRYFRKPPKL